MALFTAPLSINGGLRPYWHTLTTKVMEVVGINALQHQLNSAQRDVDLGLSPIDKMKATRGNRP